VDRPDPWQWLRYTFGGRLPDRYRAWVLYDATPVPVGLMLTAIGLALLTSLYFTLTSADELAEARLVKHGFEPGTGKTTRKERRSA
jgi:hypothetical protein